MQVIATLVLLILTVLLYYRKSLLGYLLSKLVLRIFRKSITSCVISSCTSFSKFNSVNLVLKNAGSHTSITIDSITINYNLLSFFKTLGSQKLASVVLRNVSSFSEIQSSTTSSSSSAKKSPLMQLPTVLDISIYNIIETTVKVSDTSYVIKSCTSDQPLGLKFNDVSCLCVSIPSGFSVDTKDSTNITVKDDLKFELQLDHLGCVQHIRTTSDSIVMDVNSTTSFIKSLKKNGGSSSSSKSKRKWYIPSSIDISITCLNIVIDTDTSFFIRNVSRIITTNSTMSLEKEVDIDSMEFKTLDSNGAFCDISISCDNVVKVRGKNDAMTLSKDIFEFIGRMKTVCLPQKSTASSSNSTKTSLVTFRHDITINIITNKTSLKSSTVVVLKELNVENLKIAKCSNVSLTSNDLDVNLENFKANSNGGAISFDTVRAYLDKSLVAECTSSITFSSNTLSFSEVLVITLTPLGLSMEHITYRLMPLVNALKSTITPVLSSSSSSNSNSKFLALNIPKVDLIVGSSCVVRINNLVTGPSAYKVDSITASLASTEMIRANEITINPMTSEYSISTVSCICNNQVPISQLQQELTSVLSINTNKNTSKTKFKKDFSLKVSKIHVGSDFSIEIRDVDANSSLVAVKELRIGTMVRVLNLSSNTTATNVVLQTLELNTSTSKTVQNDIESLPLIVASLKRQFVPSSKPKSSNSRSSSSIKLSTVILGLNNENVITLSNTVLRTSKTIHHVLTVESIVAQYKKTELLSLNSLSAQVDLCDNDIIRYRASLGKSINSTDTTSNTLPMKNESLINLRREIVLAVARFIKTEWKQSSDKKSSSSHNRMKLQGSVDIQYLQLQMWYNDTKLLINLDQCRGSHVSNDPHSLVGSMASCRAYVIPGDNINARDFFYEALNISYGNNNNTNNIQKKEDAKEEDASSVFDFGMNHKVFSPTFRKKSVIEPLLPVLTNISSTEEEDDRINVESMKVLWTIDTRDSVFNVVNTVVEDALDLQQLSPALPPPSSSPRKKVSKKASWKKSLSIDTTSTSSSGSKLLDMLQSGELKSSQHSTSSPRSHNDAGDINTILSSPRRKASLAHLNKAVKNIKQRIETSVSTLQIHVRHEDSLSSILLVSNDVSINWKYHHDESILSSSLSLTLSRMSMYAAPTDVDVNAGTLWFSPSSNNSLLRIVMTDCQDVSVTYDSCKTKNKGERSISEDKFVMQVPVLNISLDRHQFYQVLSVVKHVLLAAPPRRNNSTSTSQIKSPRNSNPNPNLTKARKISLIRDSLEEASTSLTDRVVKVVDYHFGGGSWRLACTPEMTKTASYDFVEVRLKDVNGNHLFFEDGSTDMKFTMGHIEVNNLKPGPSSIVFDDAVAVLAPYVLSQRSSSGSTMLCIRAEAGPPVSIVEDNDDEKSNKASSELVNVYNVVEMSIYPGTDYKIVIQLAEDLYRLMYTYFFHEDTSNNLENVTDDDGCRNDVESMIDSSEALLFGKSSKKKSGTSNHNTSKFKRPSVVTAEKKSSNDQLNFFRYIRIGNICLGVNCHGFVVSLKKFDFDCPAFVRRGKLWSWKKFTFKFMSHLKWYITKETLASSSISRFFKSSSDNSGNENRRKSSSIVRTSNESSKLLFGAFHKSK